jgi:Mat/Ecp fimbriae major subunit
LGSGSRILNQWGFSAMKKVLISAGALAALALSTPAFAAASNQASANATVNIVSPLTLVNVNSTGLNFGTVVANSGAFAGEVVHVDMTGARTCPATLTCSGATPTAALFKVTGTKSQNIVLTLPASVTLNGSVSGSLSVDLSTDEPAANEALDATGAYSFAIGGKLTIPAGTVDGVYSNTFNVTANYQ